MRDQPLIGVTSSRRGAWFMWAFYWLALRINGVRPIRIVPPAEGGLLQRLDGLVIGGGDDIGAELYEGETALDVRIDPERDRLELAALDFAVPRDLPVLGVCRGAQMLNVYFGGTLNQDIYLSNAEVPRRWTPLPAKTVTLDPDSRLAALFGVERMRVNSLHKQAIEKLGEGLRGAGRDEDGIIQAIEAPGDAFRFGVQWHPEVLIYRRSQRRLFGAFVRAAKEHVAGRKSQFNGSPPPLAPRSRK